MIRFIPLLVNLVAFLTVSANAAPADFLTKLFTRGDQPCNGDTVLCNRQYSKVSFIGTHDSPFVGSLISQNQEISVEDQLNKGIRFLQSQIHPILNVPFMCHTHCLLENAGPVEIYLKTVKQWLDRHPREVVTLLMTNPEKMKMDKWASVFKRTGTENYAFVPKTSPEPLSPDAWPTLGEMIDSGKRLVVFVDYNVDENAIPYLLDQFNYFFEGPYNTIDPEFKQCDMDRRNKVDNEGRSSMYLVNHYLDVKLGDVLVPDRGSASRTNAADGTGWSIGSQVDRCVERWGRKPNVILIDYFGRGNAMDAQVNMNTI